MATTASQEITNQRVKTVLIGVGTLASGFYAFKKQKGLVSILIFALAGGLVGGVVNSVYQNLKPSDDVNNGNGNSSGQLPLDTPLDYTGLADSLYEAFNGCTTTNNVWRLVLPQLRNQADFDALVKAYGTRKLTCLGFKTYEGDLIGAFKSELNSTEVEQVNSILKSKNISKTI